MPDEDTEIGGSDQPYQGGPYLFVALPSSLAGLDLFPLNVSRLLSEWEEMIDPVHAALAAAEEALLYRWSMGERFAVPGWNTAEWIRKLAEHDELVALFESATMRNLTNLSFRGESFPLARLVLRETVGRFGLKGGAQPVLLGLAVLAAAVEPVGLVGEQVHARLRDGSG
jgi:hypothetical protein